MRIGVRISLDIPYRGYGAIDVFCCSQPVAAILGGRLGVVLVRAGDRRNHVNGSPSAGPIFRVSTLWR